MSRTATLQSTSTVLAPTGQLKPPSSKPQQIEQQPSKGPHGLTLDLKFTQDEYAQTSISIEDSSKTSETTDTSNSNQMTSSGDDTASSEIDTTHTPASPQSTNHIFPRFTPYSNAQTQSTVSAVSQYSWNGDANTGKQMQTDHGLCKPKQFILSKKDSLAAARLSQRFKSGPRLNYEAEGLSASEVEEVLCQLEIRPDTLRDSSTDFRPVFSCIRPIVCHKSNTSFYAQCSTAKLGYCTWCRQLRRGNQKQGSICLNCGERLTAKYHRWYPHLVRLEPLEKSRTKSMYLRYKPVFERFGITWHNEKQFEFVIDHYMLMKIYLSTENFNISALHLERTYMIGVFAGREFNTGALARKLLREGSKLAMFRADFPDYYDFLRDERAAVAEQMNLRFFQGVFKCYFHAHYTNIEGWYDPSVIDRERIVKTFKELCNAILQHTAMANMEKKNVCNGNNRQQQPMQVQGGQQQQEQQQNGQQQQQMNQPQQSVQQQQQSVNNNNNLNQLQSMNHLNNLQNMMQNMGLSPMNRINVNQMMQQLPAITPTSKMNGFSFSNSTGNQQPVYLPPLATTPRFAVTPRGATPRFNMPNGGQMSAPLQIPSSLLKNTNTEKKLVEDGKNGKRDEKMTTLDEKNTLNVGAQPFFMNMSAQSSMDSSSLSNSVLSPRMNMSPRAISNGIRIEMPPHPASFAFPPPPLPQSTNWLHPVPPVLNATTPTNGALNASCLPHGAHHVNMSPMVQQQISMMNMKQHNGMNQINLNGTTAQIGSGFVNGRGSPLYTPTQSPRFQPFSH